MNVVSVDLDLLRVDIEKKRAELAGLEAVERAVVAYRVDGVAHAQKPPRPESFRPGIPTHEAILYVLGLAGKPMKTAQIVEELASRGWGKELANQGNTVYTSLDRKKHLFRKVAPGEWELVKKQE